MAEKEKKEVRKKNRQSAVNYSNARVLFVTSVIGNKGYIQHSRCAHYLDRRKIRLIETNAKCRHLKN